MALPLILGLLGSGLAGAGALGTLGVLSSPLIAGAVGSGLGSAIQTGDLREGIKTGLMSGVLGGIGGALAGGGAGLLPGAAAGGAGGAAGGAVAGATGGAAQQAAQQVAQGVTQGAAQQVTQGAAQGGLGGILQRMPTGFQGGAPLGAGATFGEMARQGLNQGVLTGAGIGAAIPGAIDAMTPPPMQLMERERRDIPEARPFRREYRAPPPGYNPAMQGEFMYFTPSNYGVTGMSRGGMVRYKSPAFSQPVRMAAGGIADMVPGVEPDMPEMNDKAMVQEAIRAVRGELPEREAAIVLGQFLQTFGEQALRKLVDDVRSGQADGPRGDVEGMVVGPGDGMDDLVPATMDDGSQDVLLSDGEFIVPADVVSGLGNGSTDAGAEELHNMMDRVRKERTGTTEQAAQVKAGGLLPA